MEDTQRMADTMRRMVVEASYASNTGHIGSALSVVDIIAVLYFSVLNHAEGEARDRFVMSKGHAAVSLYAAMALKGILPQSEIASYMGDEVLLGTHPDHALKGIDFSTGSLGMGLSYAAGTLLGSRLKGLDNRAFVLMSDGECNEGSVWEAVMFSAHMKLDALTVIVDRNHQQALGYTKDVLDMEPLEERFHAFGWDVDTVDGHDHRELLDSLSRGSSRPHIVIADTVFGKGVSFMKGKIDWHYLPMNQEQYATACAELEEGEK